MILVRGPEEAVRIVQWIYQMFIREGRWEQEIAEILNARGVPTDLGRPWTSGTVHEVLTNEKYIGNNVYNRRSFKAKRRIQRSPATWTSTHLLLLPLGLHLAFKFLDLFLDLLLRLLDIRFHFAFVHRQVDVDLVALRVRGKGHG